MPVGLGVKSVAVRWFSIIDFSQISASIDLDSDSLHKLLHIMYSFCLRQEKN